MFIVPGGSYPKDFEFLLTTATSTVYVGYSLAGGWGSISPTTLDGNTITSLTDTPASPRFYITFASGVFGGGVPASMQFYVNDQSVPFLVTCNNPGTDTIWWNASNVLGLETGRTYRIGVDLNY